MKPPFLCSFFFCGKPLTRKTPLSSVPIQPTGDVPFLPARLDTLDPRGKEQRRRFHSVSRLISTLVAALPLSFPFAPAFFATPPDPGAAKIVAKPQADLVRNPQSPLPVEKAETILKRAVDAHGGEDKILSIHDALYQFRVEPQTDPPSQSVTARSYFKGETRFRSEILGEADQVASVLNGQNGCVIVAGTTLKVPVNEILTMKNSLVIQVRPDLLLFSFPKHRFSIRTEEDGKVLDQIEVSGFLGGEYARGRLSLEASSGLVYKFEYEIEREFSNGKGIVRGEERYLKYETVEGLQVPCEIVSRQGKKVTRLVLEKARFNTALSDDLFQVTPPAPETQ
jgi:hypothetical protein